MAVYILLCKADRVAAAGILLSGSSGATNQRESLETLGCSVIGQYVVTGSYDLVTIADFPTDEHLIAYSLRCNMEGFETQPIRAFSPSEIDRAIATMPSLLEDSADAPPLSEDAVDG